MLLLFIGAAVLSCLGMLDQKDNKAKWCQEHSTLVYQVANQYHVDFGTACRIVYPGKD